MHGELARMIEPGLCSVPVVAERCRRDAKLMGEVSQQRFRYFFALRNSASTPSPVHLTTRRPCTAIVG